MINVPSVPTGEIASWFFKEKPMGFKMTENTSGEFFKTLGNQGKAQYLVRESFQNSIDGAKNQDEIIRIRIYISGIERALPTEVAEKYFHNLFDHVDACTEINVDTARLKNNACRFVTIEDFGTTGLTGNEEADSEEKGNHFFHFFRSVGRSGKEGKKLGRWGIGKFVYIMASETRSVFGYTVRDHADNFRKKFLMGYATLRYHKIGNVQFTNDGWFAKDLADYPPLPFNEIDILSNFCKDFAISRKDETGFSVVIPFCEGIESEELLFAVISEYCGSIMSKKLVVEFDYPGEQSFTVNSETISGIVEKRNDVKRWTEVSRLLSLVEFVIQNQEDKTVIFPMVSGRPDWANYVVGDDIKDRMVAILDAHGMVRIKIPVEAKQLHDANNSVGQLEIILRLCPEDNRAIHPVFFRDWLKISGRQMGSASNGIETMVFVEGGILADLLGDAEGPAHTEWTAGGEKFKGKYSYGPEWISFVKSAPKKIVELARGATNERDMSAFSDLFPNHSALDENRNRGSNSQNSGENDGTIGPKKPTPPREQIEPGVVLVELVGGFSVSLEKGAKSKYLKIKMGYEGLRGNAFNNWEHFDFEINSLDLVLKHGEIKVSEKNNLVVQVLNQDKFRLTLRGFDTARTLRVQVSPQIGPRL